MKGLVLFSLLLVAGVVFMACPYESKVPIDSPDVRLNQDLLGTWVERNDTSETYLVTQRDEYTYQILESRQGSTDHQQYLAYTSVINGISFLNLWDQQATTPDHAYMLFKLEPKDHNLVILTEVTENIDEQFTSSEALKKYIESNMRNSYFFSKEETALVRKKN